MSLVFRPHAFTATCAVVRAVGLAILATGCLSSPQATSAFDGRRAHEHIRQLVSFGPREVGSSGAARARAYIARQLSGYGIEVREQPFTAQTPLGSVRMVNVRGLIPAAGGGRSRLIVAGHYDTKLFREFRFVGANDGGSSAAFLIELGRVLAERKNPMAIELVFFDGEEALVSWEGRDNTYGSRHYVEAARADGTLGDIRALLLVDMIGDRDLRIRRDLNSTEWLTDMIWRAAGRAGRKEFVAVETEIEDDHHRFLEAEIPAVVLIDLEYPAWHTAADTLDKVSPSSLQTVADVLLLALPDIERRLAQ
jgi:glutaminyl-peptide cyclotransferase